MVSSDSMEAIHCAICGFVFPYPLQSNGVTWKVTNDGQFSSMSAWGLIKKNEAERTGLS